MWSVLRFRVDDEAFEDRASLVVDWWSRRPGCQSLELVRGVDDPQLWSIIGRWDDVGSYRRSFSGAEAKMMLTPLLSTCVDEPNTYLGPSEEAWG